MFVLQEIYATAAETPDKLAVAFNGRAISYGEFWRLIDARRRQLDPLTPESGTVLLATQHILEGWLLVLALRSLGLDTAVVRSAEEAALFEGTDVSGLITLDPEPHPELTTPAGARRLHLARLADGPVSTAGPLGPQPNLRPPGGHILLTSGTTGRHKKIRSTSGEKPDQIRARRERYQELEGHRPTGEDTVSAIFNFGLWTAAGYAQPIFTWCQRGGVVIHQDDDFHRALDWPGLTHATVTPYSLSRLMALPDETVRDIEGFTYALDAGGNVVKTEMGEDAVFREPVNEYWSRSRFTLPASSRDASWSSGTPCGRSPGMRYAAGRFRAVSRWYGASTGC